MTIDRFIDLASIRVAAKTQLPVLCHAILRRNITTDTSNEHSLQRYIILAAAGDLNALLTLTAGKNKIVYD